jgi:hypothetical protein
MSEEQPIPGDATQLAIALAMRQAMHEIMQENKEEILKRTRAKLMALGITMSDEEVRSEL